MVFEFRRAAVLGLIALSLDSGAALADGEKTVVSFRTVNEQVADKLAAVMGQCPGRVSPGYSWKDLSVVLVDEGSTLIGLEAGTLRRIEVPRAELPAGIEQAYAFFESNGVRWMSLNVMDLMRGGRTSTIPELVEVVATLGIHEGFHHEGQRNWVIGKSRRGTTLPILTEPRLLRASIQQHMMAALINPANEAAELGQAAFYFAAWKAQFAEESGAATDGYEGTARTTDALGAVLMKQGCGISEADLIREATADLQSRGSVFEAPIFALDFEGYEMGASAMLILRRQGRDVAALAEMAASGVTPVEFLLRDQPMRIGTFDPATRARLEAIGKTESERARSLTQPTLDRLSSGTFTLLGMPGSWYGDGSFSPINFFLDRVTRVSLVPMALPMNFTGPDGVSKLRSLEKAVFVSDVGRSPCLKASWTAVLAPADFTAADATSIEVKAPLIQGSARGQFKTAADGRRWFCAGE